VRKPLHLLLLSAVLLAQSCRRSGDSHDHDQADGEAHTHEETTGQITVWTDRYEVFAEHKAPVVSKPAKFITHVTDLHTFAPRMEGMIKFELRQGASAFEHPQAAPERPGIYIPAIIFPNPGDWQATILIPTDGTNAIVGLGTIKVYPDDHSAAHAEFPDPSEGVPFLKEQQWKILSKTERVTKRRLVERVPLPADVRAKPGFSATVAAPLAGQLATPSGRMLPQPGTQVEAGEVLALLRPRFSDSAARFIEIASEFGRAEAVLKQAEAAFVRTKKLAAQKARSERELQEAEGALAIARAQHAAATTLRSTYANSPESGSGNGVMLELRAPIAGTVTSVGAGLGEPVDAGQVVFRMLNPTIVWIEAHVPEKSRIRPENARDAIFQSTGDQGGFVSVLENGGHLVFVGIDLDPKTRTLPLIYELKNQPSRLRVGESIRLHVETARTDEVVAVPSGAIVTEGGQPVAFVQVSGETFAKRELQLGIRDGDFVEVRSGLTEGERVVTKGAYAVRLSSISGVIPAHGHAH
jgi:RND family efflux transporter MFP subunit